MAFIDYATDRAVRLNGNDQATTPYNVTLENGTPFFGGVFWTDVET